MKRRATTQQIERAHDMAFGIRKEIYREEVDTPTKHIFIRKEFKTKLMSTILPKDTTPAIVKIVSYRRTTVIIGNMEPNILTGGDSKHKVVRLRKRKRRTHT